VIKIVSLVLVFLPCVLSAQDIVLRGRVVDPQGNALPNATVQIADRNQVVARTKSAADGKFLLQVRSTGELTINVDAPGFRSVSQPVSVRAGGNSKVVISLSQLASHFESVTVTADVNGSDIEDDLDRISKIGPEKRPSIQEWCRKKSARWIW